MWPLAKSSSDYVNIIIRSNEICFCLISKTIDTYTVNVYQHHNFSPPIASKNALTNATLIQKTILSFLQDHRLVNSFITIALDLSSICHVIIHDLKTHEKPPTPGMNWQTYELDEAGTILSTGIPGHVITQCSLLAHTTPFHCAGITAYRLAQISGAHQLTTPLPAIPVDIHEYVHELTTRANVYSHVTGNTKAITPQDLLCAIGLYLSKDT